MGARRTGQIVLDVCSAMRYNVGMKEAPVSLRLDRELRKALEDLATKDLRTLSDYIRVVLTRHVEHKKEGGK